MQQAIGRILKGDDVELEGQYRLQVTQPEPSSAESQRLGAASAEVRLVFFENCVDSWIVHFRGLSLVGTVFYRRIESRNRMENN